MPILPLRTALAKPEGTPFYDGSTAIRSHHKQVVGYSILLKLFFYCRETLSENSITLSPIQRFFGSVPAYSRLWNQGKIGIRIV